MAGVYGEGMRTLVKGEPAERQERVWKPMSGLSSGECSEWHCLPHLSAGFHPQALCRFFPLPEGVQALSSAGFHLVPSLWLLRAMGTLASPVSGGRS